MMRVRSRQIADFPQAPDQGATPYGLNEFTPSARTLSDANTSADLASSTTSSKTSKISIRLAKSVFTGDVGVGKTSIINRFCRDIFEQQYKATIGVDYEMERFWILNVPFNLQIWDTAGQEKFKCIAASYYRGSNVIVTVFDASNLETLSTCQRWMDDAVGANVVVPLKFLVATKLDLVPEGHRDKIYQMGNRMANLLGAEFWAISSKTGENVEHFFRRLTVLAFETGLANEVKESISRHYVGLPHQSSILRPSESDDTGFQDSATSCSSCKTS
jgi:small GTP-binding protein